MKELFAIKNLALKFKTHGGHVHALRDINYSVKAGETLAVVGESGSGKSVTVQASMGLLPQTAIIEQGEILFESEQFGTIDLAKMTRQERQKICGKEIAMIFQNPMNALNPTMKIGAQISEVLKLHCGLGKSETKKRSIELLKRCRIPEPEARLEQYPFEMSGGMLQRIMIAMAIASKPKLLIADEPTTALDVTVQDQILALLQEIQAEEGMAIILITHDLSIVARMAKNIAVCYAGEIIELGACDEVFYQAAHPYSSALQRALPSEKRGEKEALKSIPGSPPDLFKVPTGCSFAPRCEKAMQVCQEFPADSFQISDSHLSRCWLHHPHSQSSGASHE